MYKRALDAPQQNQSKPVKIRKKKSEDMLCFICGDKAIGFNYNVISCAACKVFFRRYANSVRLYFSLYINFELFLG